MDMLSLVLAALKNAVQKWEVNKGSLSEAMFEEKPCRRTTWWRKVAQTWVAVSLVRAAIHLWAKESERYYNGEQPLFLYWVILFGR